MKKAWLRGLLAVVLLALPLAAAAAGPGSIRVRLTEGEKAVENMSIALYYIGQPEQGGYRMTGELGGGFLPEAEVLYPKTAQELMKLVRTGTLSRTNAQGDAVFSSLEEGLYLAAGEGDLFEPFTIPLPWDGSQWDITAAPRLAVQSPDTSDPGWFTGACWGLFLSGLGLIVLTALGKGRGRFHTGH